MSYSIDLRKRVLDFLDDGNDKEEASKLFQVGRSTVYRWLKRRNKFGTIKPMSTATTKHRKHDPKKLREFIKKNNDSTLNEVAKHFGMTIPGIWYALRNLNITLKKRLFVTKKEMKNLESVF